MHFTHIPNSYIPTDVTIEITFQTNYNSANGVENTPFGIQANTSRHCLIYPDLTDDLLKMKKTPSITFSFSVVEMLNHDHLPTYMKEISICPRSSVNPPFSIPAGAK